MFHLRHPLKTAPPFTLLPEVSDIGQKRTKIAATDDIRLKRTKNQGDLKFSNIPIPGKYCKPPLHDPLSRLKQN